MELVAQPPYPDLTGLETAFVGFCAAFDGVQDAAHIADAGLHAVCVDRDQEKLAEMSEHYPEDWALVTADVYDYAQRCISAGLKYDIVSLDPFTSQMQECADRLDLWTQLATRMIVLGTGRDTWLPLDLDGWEITDTLQRSRLNGGVYWTVLERQGE